MRNGDEETGENIKGGAGCAGKDELKRGVAQFVNQFPIFCSERCCAA
jgi:hypothetical protein